MERFASCFSELEDPREDNARHDLHEILVIALCAMLCGAADCSDMALFGGAKQVFLRQFLRLRRGIPSHDTFSRVFRLLDPAQFHACVLRFMEHFAATTQGVIAIDGKVVQKGGDYVLALKGNQGTLFEDVRLCLDDPAHAAALFPSEPEVDQNVRCFTYINSEMRCVLAILTLPIAASPGHW
jgi:DDE_Tnp_1-associated